MFEQKTKKDQSEDGKACARVMMEFLYARHDAAAKDV